MAVMSSEIAAFLDKPLVGQDVLIHGAKPATKPEAHNLVFVKRYTPELLSALNTAGEVLVLAVPDYEGQLAVPHIITPKPRLDFAKVLQQFFASSRRGGLAGTAVIAPSAHLGDNVSVGHFSVIGEGVQIGDNTEIRNYVVVGDNCVIGRNCLVKSNTVIGEKGFGFEFDQDSTPIGIPHLGGVVIGDEVEIGALNTVVRGTLEDTVVSDHVKTDDHVHIAHNVFIDRNTVITACAEISGSVRIGKNVWIGPNASIINSIDIGDNVLVGIGAVVIKSVESDVVVAGNPAKILRKRFEK